MCRVPVAGFVPYALGVLNSRAEAVILVDCCVDGGGCLKRLQGGVGGGRVKSGDILGGGRAKTGFGRLLTGVGTGDVSRADKGGGGVEKLCLKVQFLKIG